MTGCERNQDMKAKNVSDEMMLDFVSAKESEEIPENEDQAWYAQMKTDALLSMGNNGRLDGVLRKLERGEQISVVAIGGSVTEGAGASSFDKAYADLFVQGLRDRYPEAQVDFLNVGLSGTPSSLGVIRYDHDVTEKLEQNPDLVIIEFAVNDWQEETGSRAYESMIKNILQKDEKTAVVLMFAVFRNKWNLEELYTDMGELYGLPMVSAKIGTREAFEQGKISDEEFFFDEYHPTGYGHRVMADCLLYMVDQKLQHPDERKELTYERVSVGTEFTNMHMVEAGDVQVTAGGFSEKDPEIQGFQRTGEKEFANNWMHTEKTGREAFRATFTCKNILLDFKTSNRKDYGKAEIYVDGIKVREADGYSQGGWNNSNVILVLDEKEVKMHTLEVKMAEGSENKRFTILTIGYSD